MRLLLLAVVMAGCAPLDGYPCQKEDAQQCDGRNVAFCERTSAGGLKWKTYDCPSGCNALAAEGASRCEWLGVMEGAACPTLRASAPCVDDGVAIGCGTGTWQRQPCALCQKDKRLEDVPGVNCSGGLCRCQ